jgi:hypothetical protein
MQDITPIHNALDSLRRMAHELEHGGEGKKTALGYKGALAWGWHVCGLLAYLRLKPARETFDAWMRDYLQEGTPSLDVERDARWEERERLSFLELLDLLSEENLPSLKPEFYQGWQDRSSRCLWLRQQVRLLTGCSIDAEKRDLLLYLLAVYHRLIRLPAGVAISARPIVEALPALFDLLQMLIDDTSPDAHTLYNELERCRQALIAVR